jgi:lipopolysaccharide heptosyltransferase II
VSRTGWQSAKRILCVRLDNMGDVLMTTPALRALKRSAPQRQLTLLASRTGAMAADFVHEIDDVIVYAAPWMKQEGGELESVLPMAQTLRRHAFDAAVIFTVYSQSPLPAAMLCGAAGIPLRLAHCRENPYSLLTDWLPEIEPQGGVRHEVQRQLDLVAHIGCHTQNTRLSLSVPPHAMAWAQQRLRALGIDAGDVWMLIHPGATAPSRRYPPELWAQAARRLALEHGCPIVFAGAESEAELVRAIQADMRADSLSLCGELDLARLAAIIALAPVLLCNNSAPAHIAAATGTPVVDLYALTNPQHTPWQVAHRVLFHDVPCRFCYRSVCPQGHHGCLRNVDPAAVAAAASALLARREAGAERCAVTRTVSDMLDAPERSPARAVA